MNFAENWKVEGLPNISEAQLQNFLSVAENLAHEIEKILAPIIGRYEIIKIFHNWLPSCKNSRLALKSVAKEFSLHINHLTGSPYGKQPGVNLSKYYSAL